MSDGQGITLAEQRVLDAINTCYKQHEANPAACVPVLAALRAYGAEQRLQGYTAGHRDANLLADYEAQR